MTKTLSRGLRSGFLCALSRCLSGSFCTSLSGGFRSATGQIASPRAKRGITQTAKGVGTHARHQALLKATGRRSGSSTRSQRTHSGATDHGTRHPSHNRQDLPEQATEIKRLGQTSVRVGSETSAAEGGQSLHGFEFVFGYVQ
ncbi:hypothetical protein D3C72_1209470 [compost metagenome]